LNTLSVLLGREVEVFELVPKVRQRQTVHCSWDRLEERSKQTVRHDRTRVLRMLTV